MALAILPSVATAGHPAPSQEVVTLHGPKKGNHKVYSSAGGRKVGHVANRRPITGESTALPVLKSHVIGSTTWLKVLLPGRPNGHSGWIKSINSTESIETWHIVVSTEKRKMWIYNHGKLVRSWLVVVGRPSAPTPHGNFFVEENIYEGYNFAGGPYALATSARSNTYHEFDGGPGQVALHGMANGLQATPGSDVSHGCVRSTNAEITWLATKAGGSGIFPGTPVTIR